jgi:hypothetical protein
MDAATQEVKATDRNRLNLTSAPGKFSRLEGRHNEDRFVSLAEFETLMPAGPVLQTNIGQQVANVGISARNVVTNRRPFATDSGADHREAAIRIAAEQSLGKFPIARFDVTYNYCNGCWSKAFPWKPPFPLSLWSQYPSLPDLSASLGICPKTSQKRLRHNQRLVP